MNTEEALEIINNNAASKEHSYLYFMHECGEFEAANFWKFYNAIRLLGFACSNEDTLDRDLTQKILKSYEWHLMLIGFHFDKNDSNRIANLPQNYSQYSLRLRSAVNAFIEGNPISDTTESCLNDELDNPLKNEYPTMP